MILTRRSQSALEYMMTYGWAILIIVIVAVILYSMGIFNPSSSVTFTSSGFSPFTVSSSLCNNIGYKIAVLAGPIPNNANSITINKVFLTSATGANTTTASYTLTSPVTLKSGQSATILIPNVACNSANTHYSLSAKIQYSYTASTLGLQTVNTTGTVAGTSITGKPSTLTSYEPITITNTQSSATPSPFQQMINFTSSDPGFSSIATGNFGQNVEFFYYNGTIIPSWLENYTSTNGLWWLKIAAIPGGSSETIYVGFVPTSTNLFNTVNDGEAPQLSCSNPSDTASCSTYAEYDDGNNVFNYYTNFAGTILNSTQWVARIASGNSVTVNNGLTLSGSGSWTFIQSKIAYNPQKYISDTYGYASSTATMQGGNWGWVGDQNNGAGGNQQYFVNTYNNAYYSGIWTGSAWFELSNLGAGSTSSPFVMSVYTNTSAVIASVNYGPEVSNLGDFVASTGLSAGFQQGEGVTVYIQWFRLRAIPPNGVMPSVSFGSVA